MDSVTDPVTGLPIVGGSGDALDQIVLGVQPTPWDDLSPDSKPNRPTLYPDDAFDTFALITGFNQNNPDKSQAVYTDGQHNLRVNVENYAQFPSGGGGGASAPTYVDGSGTGYGVHLLHGQHCYIGNNALGARYLLGYFCSVDWESGNAATTLQAWASVDLYSNLGAFMLALGVLTSGGFTALPANNVPLHANDRVNFPGGIDLTQFFADPSLARVQVTCNAWNCYVSGNSYFSSTL